MTVRDIVMVLGDQLSTQMSALRDADPARDIVLMCEVAEETDYAGHHKQKIALIFSAMRHFARALREAGWRVEYVALDDAGNGGSFTSVLARAVERHKPRRVVATEAGEWRVEQMMLGWEKALGVPVVILPDDRFLCSRAEFAAWAAGRKQLTMEYFYREMRRKTGLLMNGDEPEGGQWNFDKENRKPAKADMFMPRLPRFEPDGVTRAVIDMVGTRFQKNFGDLDAFGWPVTQAQAEEALDAFIDKALPSFGDHQDAMLEGEDFLYHSLLSPAINLGLLDPLAVCRRAERAYLEGAAPLNAVEGFIRQIIGWREYVRGVYWLKMPGYRDMNALDARRPLPWFYWSGETDMNCIAHVVGQTKRLAYAHHIQRLMVTGTFALLAGIRPQEVHEWYLAVYADAYEWVELPNTLGMSQFADGGILGSKPYAASGAYINRMSDYCGGCRYKVAKKTGADACPFNALYWDFLARNEKTLRGNHRLAQVYRNWDRMDAEHRQELRASAAAFLRTLE
jgi:deoxyribodipyrimidine photolyase-related protein